MRRLACVVLLAMACVRPSLAAAPADSVDLARFSRFQAGYFARSAPLVDAGNFLGVLGLLDSLRAEVGPSARAEDFARQMAGTYDSFVGREQEALAAFRRVPPKAIFVDTTAWSGFRAEPAVDAIARLARTHPVVFVNEAHHVPRHRAFTAALLPRLHALGFRYLALEALDERDSALAQRGYPVRATGFYTNEPAFGALIREALALGFTLVPYEATGDDMRTQDARETAEARHLAERIFARDPQARVLVHAGYAHVDESATPGRASPMAVRFREATGIDPLTIDQVTMADRGDPRFDDARRAGLLPKSRGGEPFVLARGDSCWSAKPGTHDVTVITPSADDRAGRPGWLWRSGDRRPYVVPAALAPRGVDCVVTARRAGEAEDAVPVDALRVGRSRTLLLPPGRYVVTARDGAGRMLGRKLVSIRL